MATITIRNLDDTVKRRLQVRAAINGRSMEAEARALLSELVEPGAGTEAQEEGLGSAIHRRFAAIGGVELQIPPRQFSIREGKETAQEEASAPLKEGLGTAINKLFAPPGGVELEPPPRQHPKHPDPTFEP